MHSYKKPLKILYNGAQSNLRPEKITAQGGPSRFSDGFRKYFLKHKDILLMPFLFRGTDASSSPKVNPISVSGKVFYELVYNKDLMTAAHKQNAGRKMFIKEISPIIEQVRAFFELKKPDVVFLNGFSVTNWILLYIAHAQNVPVVIQHAGIWKKEIRRKGNAYNASTRKLFYQMERDTIKWHTHHVFLNTYSKNVFMRLYRVKNESAIPWSIIALPIPLPSSYVHPVFEKTIKKDAVNIGMVARWDSIKNHSAILRLATAANKPKKWHLHTATAIPSMEYEFPKKYVSAIRIHKPMPPKELTAFYRSMDIVLLPSHFDVSPTVVAESLLAQTPIVISNQVGWCGEFIRAGLQDHIISPNISGTSFVRVITNILAKLEENKHKYELLVGYIEKWHEPDRVFASYKNLFIKTAQAKNKQNVQNCTSD